MSSETVSFSHPGGTSLEWVQVADASHDHVSISSDIALGSQATRVYVGGSPGGAFSIPGGDDRKIITIDNPNADVWVRLSPGESISVIRGDARVSVST